MGIGKNGTAIAAKNVIAAMESGAVQDPWFEDITRAVGRILDGERGWVRLARTRTGVRLSIRRGDEKPVLRRRRSC